jgi:hypothetical protein
MLDCSTLADGAAALLIVNENLARELDGVRIRMPVRQLRPTIQPCIGDGIHSI